MKCTIPEISWHNRDPVLSIDIQCNISKGIDPLYRLATGGTDSHVLIWLLTVENGGVASLEYAADLSRHTKPVNCVRFSPSGELLASGDDESCIIIWKMKSSGEPMDFPMGEETEGLKEQWTSVRVLRGHLQDVYDLSWSSDSKNLISGSVDNTAIMWDVATGKNLGILGEHKGFVQGVAWDPCGQYLATMSSDRVCRVYNAASRRVIGRMYKGLVPGADAESKPTHYFHDDTLKSFFRRLTFSPDGELLIIPSGLIEEAGKKAFNATIICSRHCLNKPCVFLPTLSQYTVAVRCCPVSFTLRPLESAPLFDLPYRIVIAVATQSSVLLYDTQHAAPFAIISNMHYTRLTDLSWSSDGRILMVASTDGYCSVITFSEGELGTVYTGPKKITEHRTESGNTKMSKDKLSSAKKSSSKISTEISLPISEDANMPQVAKVKSFVKEKISSEANLTPEDVSEKVQSTSTSTLVAKEVPMEVDDFELVYEGTITEPVLETSSINTEKSTVTPVVESLELTEEKNAPLAEAGSEPTKSFTNALELTAVSPKKLDDSCKSLQQTALTSPVGASSAGQNITPGNSCKKTPRRVQLITLSSPKSKKKLLD